jgi:peptide/nickel transport system substrate-binding protein
MIPRSFEEEIEMKRHSLVYKLVVLLVLTGFILVGCTPTPEVTTPPDEPDGGIVDDTTDTDDDVVEPAPRPDIVIAVQSLNDTHDPTDTYNIAIPILTNLYDQLVVRDFGDSGLDAAAAPGLAESWTQVSDLEWELTLREGVLFHDGTEMTADDVVFTLTSEERRNIDWAGMGAPIVSAEAVDTYTVKVTTAFADAAFPARMQTYIGWVLPKAYYLDVGEDEFGIAPIGTGPYYQSEFVPLDHLTLTAFDDYWGGTPPVNSITFVVVPELSSRIAGLLAGEYHIASGIPPDQMVIIEAAADLKVVGSMVDNFTALIFRSEHADRPEGNQDFRQALIYGLDRAQLTEALWSGLTEHPNGTQFRAFGEFYDPDFAGIEYDLTMAEDLLARSGYDGEEIRIQYLKGYFPVFDQAMEFALQSWTDLGVNVILEPLESWTLFNYDVAALSSTSYSADITDASWLYTRFFDPAAWIVQSGAHTPTEDELALGLVLQSGTDAAERQDAYDSLLASWEEKALIISFWYQYYAYGMRNEVEIIPYSNFGLDFRPGSFSLTAP